MNSDSRDQPLTVEITDEGVLLISIGVVVLSHAIELNPDYNKPDGSSAVAITDIDKFAAAVVEELQREKEDGTTPVHVMLDKAANQAIENGAEGASYDDQVEDI